MKEGSPNKSIYRKDYKAYPWDVHKLDLYFDIGRETTIVRAEMEFQLKGSASATRDIVLNGSKLELLSLSLNGRLLGDDDYVIDGETLVILRLHRQECVDIGS